MKKVRGDVSVSAFFS